MFVVDEAPEGGYVARAVGESILTEVDDLDSLREMVRDAWSDTSARTSDRRSCASISSATSSSPCEAAARHHRT